VFQVVAVVFRQRNCFPKNDPPLMLGIPQSSVGRCFLSKSFNAIAKNVTQKQKKEETTGMGNGNWRGRASDQQDVRF
jgi:hypothetical protein